jgi:hypothetical protein
MLWPYSLFSYSPKQRRQIQELEECFTSGLRGPEGRESDRSQITKSRQGFAEGNLLNHGLDFEGGNYERAHVYSTEMLL